MVRCNAHLCLPATKPRSLVCFVLLPCTLLRHILKLLGFISRRISVITSFSVRPNCSLMESKLVRSSQAISIILLVSMCASSAIFNITTGLYSCFKKNCLPLLLAPIKTHLICVDILRYHAMIYPPMLYAVLALFFIFLQQYPHTSVPLFQSLRCQ